MPSISPSETSPTNTPTVLDVPKSLSEPYYDQIRNNMLYNGLTVSTHGLPPKSSLFTDRMSEIVDDNEDKRVDAFLFTANSAIPVADAVRGYYEEKGLDLPYLGYISANRASADYTGIRRYSHITKEAKRLHGNIKGTGRVAVVEQYTAFGNTLNLARQIARATRWNAEVLPIAGKWYQDVTPNEVDLGNMTSAHAPFMKEVGRLAAQSTAKIK